MAENFDWWVNLRFRMQGASEVKSQIDGLNKAVTNQEKAWERAQKSEARAAQKSSKSLSAREKAFERQDRIYTNYLEKQEAGYAKQDALYNQYLTHQTNATKKAADQRARDIEAAEAKAAAATKKRVAAENSLSRQTKRADNSAAVKAWNDEFKAISKVVKEQERAEQSTISLRYANYDLASSLLKVSAALTAVGAASVVAFASQEKAFTTVERIVSGSSSQIGELRDELTALSTEIPQSFNDLSGIASLGAALDIPAESLAKFTETVAKFSATTGVTTEAAATGFGRLAAYLEIPAEKFDALGSAILKAGNIAVANEEQVLKFSEALALPGARAGVSAEQVVALGATIASFGNINVEGAGSALTRIFNNIDRAVASGDETLQNFAAAAGYSAQQFGIAWQKDAGDVLNRVVNGLSGDIDNLSTNLDALGVKNVRDRRIIEALVINYDKYASILGRTTDAWREGIYMNEAYGLVLDDLSSQWQIFLNAMTNFAASVGSAVAPALGELLSITTDVLVNLQKFADNPVGQVLTRMVGGIVAVIALWAGLRGAMSLATASLYAFNFATQALGGAGLRKGISGIAAQLGLAKVAADGATVSTITLRSALMGLMKATVVLGLFSLLGQVVLDFGGTVEWVGQRLVDFANFLNTITGNSGAFNLGRDLAQGMVGWGRSMKSATDETYGLGAAGADASDYLRQLQEDLEDTEVPDLDPNGNLEDVTKKVYTLVDYANDLSSVWSRAFDIRFSGQSTLDTITKSFQDMRDAAAESAQKIRELKADLQGLDSDINIQKQFLAVAVQYGDQTRAQAIQAEIAKLEADRAKKLADLNKEQESNNRTLVGNSQAAIQNRSTILGLVQQYQAHIQALAASGMSTEDLKRATDQLQQDFITQATQLGYNSSELGIYTAAFRDVKVAIDNIPRNITVDFNADPALQALNEFMAQAAANSAAAGNNAGTTFGNSLVNAVTPKIQTVADMLNNTFLAGAMAPNWTVSTGTRGRKGGGTFAEGGYTGAGGKYEPAGIVHRGEYVIPKHMVNQSTGLPYSDALGRLQRGAPSRSGYANGGFVRGGGGTSGPVSLTAGTIQAIGQVMDKVLSVDGRVIGDTASRSYARDTSVGRS